MIEYLPEPGSDFKMTGKGQKVLGAPTGPLRERKEGEKVGGWVDR